MQTLHIGPYASEPDTLEKMHAFMAANHLVNLVGAGGKHHEIYMGDPRKSAPEKLKTVLRLPVKKKLRMKNIHLAYGKTGLDLTSQTHGT